MKNIRSPQESRTAPRAVETSAPPGSSQHPGRGAVRNRDLRWRPDEHDALTGRYYVSDVPDLSVLGEF